MKAILAACVLVGSVAGIAVAADMSKSCGQMMVDKAALPSKMAELMTAVADTMDAHAAFMIANGKGNKDAMTEAEGMKQIAKEHRELATTFTKTADHMRAASKWPNVPHDHAKMMADTKLQDAVKKMVKTEQEMSALMQSDLAMMESMTKTTN